MKKEKILFFSIFLGLLGWIFWLYVFWIILLFPNPRGYYLNPFKFHEYWIEFFMIHLFVIFLIFILIKYSKEL